MIFYTYGAIEGMAAALQGQMAALGAENEAINAIAKNIHWADEKSVVEYRAAQHKFSSSFVDMLQTLNVLLQSAQDASSGMQECDNSVAMSWAT